MKSEWQAGSAPDAKAQGLYWVRTKRGFGGSEIGYHSAYWSGCYWHFRDGSSGRTGRIVTHYQVIEEPVELGEREIYEDGLDRMGCAAQAMKGVELTTGVAK